MTSPPTSAPPPPNANDEAERVLWDELLRHDRACDVESVTRCAVRLLLVLGARRAQCASLKASGPIGAYNDASATPTSAAGAGALGNAAQRDRVTFAALESWLRAANARSRLVPCSVRRLFNGTYPSHVQCRHPSLGQASAVAAATSARRCEFYVSVSVEEEAAVRAELAAQGVRTHADHMQRLAECGYLVVDDAHFGDRDGGDARLAAALRAFATATNGHHVQLDAGADAHANAPVPREPSRPRRVVSASAVAACVVCRRIASPPVVALRAAAATSGADADNSALVCSDACDEAWCDRHAAVAVAASDDEDDDDDDDDDV